MESFKWDDCFVTGLSTVDEQHRRLVDIINRFGRILTRPGGALAQDTELVLAELTAYADHHFKDEERLMTLSGLDRTYIRQHHQLHADFLLEVKQLYASIATDGRSAAHALLDFLIHWLTYHILGSDQIVARQIAAIAAGGQPQDVYLATQKHDDPVTETLIQALNGLFQQVSERNHALLELNQTLETRVVERTQELSDANQQLEELAMTDVLTGLPNRRNSLRCLQREWQVALRHNTPLACMMIDADGFKAINDSFGHEAGDEVLRRLSLQLRSSVRIDDIVCRFGGDEFLVICARTPLDAALQIAEKLCQEVAGMRVATGRGEWQGSVSIGVAVRDAAMKEPEELIRLADDGAYLAKRNGRNCVATVCATAAN